MVPLNPFAIGGTATLPSLGVVEPQSKRHAVIPLDCSIAPAEMAGLTMLDWIWSRHQVKCSADNVKLLACGSFNCRSSQCSSV